MRKENWWVNYPWRMVQTNLREIDMDQMNAEAFAESLKVYHATAVTLNAAGILASYNTKLPYHPKSEYLTGDSLKQMIEECHKRDIKVIARCDFSKIQEKVFEEHPDWAYRTAEGNVVNYNGFVQTCVNSDYQQKYVFEILKELFAEHDFDGLFCNMSSSVIVDYDFNVYGPCHCENCKKLFAEQFGAEIPETDDRRNPVFGKYMGFKNQCMAKQKKMMYEVVKSINPGIAVNGFDYYRVESNQDMDRPSWIYQTSTNARKTVGPNLDKVCDSAITDFLGFQYRHTAISPALLEVRQWQNLANSGSTSLFVMGDLEHHRDRSSIRASKKAFDFYAEHESVYEGLRSDAEVLLIHKMLLARVDAEVSGFIRALTECHIPFDEMKFQDVTPEILEKKKLVILADDRFISDEAAALLDAYVERGGILLATGESGCNASNFRPRTENAFKSLGVGKILEKRMNLKSSLYEITEADEEIFSQCADMGLGYIIPGKEVVISEILDESKTQKYMKLIPEQLYGPPEVCYPKEFSEIPGVLKTAYGKGFGIYVPWLVGTFYYEQGQENTFTFMKDLLLNVCGVVSISKNTTPMCEITVHKNEKHTLIQLVNTTGCFANSFFEPVPLYQILLEWNLKEGSKVKALNGGNVTWNQGKLVLDCLNVYEAIVIENEE